MKFATKTIRLILFLSFIILFTRCDNNPPVIDKFTKEYSLVNQNGKQVDFPQIIKGKITVVGYIYTNCPDICPLTTNNMQRIQKEIAKDNIKNVEFVSISFDPVTDTPEVLRKYAEIRNLNLDNWVFLTGQKTVIDSLIKQAGVFAAISDSTVLTSGKKTYYYVHTDRIQLLDEDGNILKNYSGSRININEIVADIKKLS